MKLARPDSLARVAALSGGDMGALPDRLKDFLLAFRGMDGTARQAAVALEPPATGNTVADAYIAAVAELLSHASGFAAPGWAAEPGRFLRSPWFAATSPRLKAILEAESPPPFRKRNLFVSANALDRPGFQPSRALGETTL